MGQESTLAKTESLLSYLVVYIQPPKCENVSNVDVFYFDLTCDVISYREANKFRFRSTNLTGL